jgi:hypothetical protein
MEAPPTALTGIAGCWSGWRSPPMFGPPCCKPARHGALANCFGFTIVRHLYAYDLDAE